MDAGVVVHLAGSQICPDSLLLFTVRPIQQRAEKYFYSVESNGLAAGNVLEEAILQGFFEVIERDAVSIWWYNRLNRPSVDLDSFHDSYFDALHDYYASFGREFWVLDLTTDSGIPTFVAISRKVENEHEALTFGSGTHFDVRIAISRALTEMNQALYLMESGRMAERTMSDREQFMNIWNQTARLEDQPYLAPAQQISPKTCASYSEWYNEDIRDDLEQCFDIARNLGLDIPGERPLTSGRRHECRQSDCSRFTVTFGHALHPGGCYDVPVQQGWLQTPTPESEMNPITWWI